MAFARAVADMAEDIKKTCRGMPRGTAANGYTPTALETLELVWASESALWAAADLGQVFSYLRKHKALRIPEAWKALVPRSLE